MPEVVASEEEKEPQEPVRQEFKDEVAPQETVRAQEEPILAPTEFKSSKGMPKYVSVSGMPKFVPDPVAETAPKVIAGTPKFVSLSAVPKFISQVATLEESAPLSSDISAVESSAENLNESVPTVEIPSENIEVQSIETKINPLPMGEHAEAIEPDPVSVREISEAALMEEILTEELPQTDSEEKAESMEAFMEEVKAEAIEEIQEEKIEEMPIRELAYEPKVGSASPKFMQLPGVPKFIKEEEEVIESVFTEPTDASESIDPMTEDEPQLSEETKKDLAATAQYTREELGLEREEDSNESQEMGIFCNEQEEYYRSQYYFLKSQVDFYKRQKGYYQKQLSVSENQLEFYAQQAEMYLQQADFYRTKKDED